MNMPWSRRGLALAIAMLLAAALPARAADTATADDTAKFLAGMTPSADSPLTPLTKDPAWQRHARFFDTAFAQLEQRQISKIRAWSDTNLAAPKPTMFYMFSGPDFLYANAFYPKATTYVLSALEPPGAVPDLTKLPRGGVGAALYNVERSLGSILSFSFFITKQMKVDLHAGQISGTLPILYVFLARSGKTVRDVSSITLDDQGVVHPGSETAAPNAVRGTRILFAGSDGVERTLYYFSTDLSNPGVRASGFLKFCSTLAPGNSLIKSASYLLHSGNFATVRDYILANSATSSRTIPEFHSPITARRNGGSSRSAVMPARSRNSRASIRNPTPNCSDARSRWISASAIAGARMNRTCCCRSGCPTTAQRARTRRHRPMSHRRRGPSGRDRLVRRNKSNPGAEAVSSGLDAS